MLVGVLLTSFILNRWYLHMVKSQKTQTDLILVSSHWDSLSQSNQCSCASSQIYFMPIWANTLFLHKYEHCIHTLLHLSFPHWTTGYHTTSSNRQSNSRWFPGNHVKSIRKVGVLSGVKRFSEMKTEKWPLGLAKKGGARLWLWQELWLVNGGAHTWMKWILERMEESRCRQLRETDSAQKTHKEEDLGCHRGHEGDASKTREMRNSSYSKKTERCRVRRRKSQELCPWQLRAGSSGHIGEVWPTVSVEMAHPTQRAGKSDRKVGVWTQTRGVIWHRLPNGHFIFLLVFNCIYLCLTVLGLHYCAGFSPVQRVRATPQLQRAGFSLWRLLVLWSTGSRAHRLQQFWHTGSVVVFPGSMAQALWLRCTGWVSPWHVGSSRTRDQTHVTCIGRQTLYHYTTREAPKWSL